MTLNPSPRSQAAKLGIRPGQRIHLHHPPPGWALADPPPALADAGAEGPGRATLTVVTAFLIPNGDGDTSPQTRARVGRTMGDMGFY
ncbi:MAG: hypothetical protein ACRDOU_26855 [Streptosporangiaceae bacterium]